VSEYLDLVEAARQADPTLSPAAAHELVRCSEHGFQAYREYLSSKGIFSATAPSSISSSSFQSGSPVAQYRELVRQKRAAGLNAEDAHRQVMRTPSGSAAYRASLTARGIIRGDEQL
jgi:hypothetical protein